MARTGSPWLTGPPEGPPGRGPLQPPPRASGLPSRLELRQSRLYHLDRFLLLPLPEEPHALVAELPGPPFPGSFFNCSWHCW